MLTKKDFLVQYRTTVTAGFDVSEAEVEETKDKVTTTIPHCTVDEDSIKIKPTTSHYMIRILQC